jgi:hypothetical protein
MSCHIERPPLCKPIQHKCTVTTDILYASCLVPLDTPWALFASAGQ